MVITVKLVSSARQRPVLAAPVPEDQERAEQEQRRDDRLQRPVRQQREQRAREQREHDLYGEPSRRPREHVAGPELGHQDQAGQCGLVGQFSEEDDAEGGRYDRRVHGSVAPIPVIPVLPWEFSVDPPVSLCDQSPWKPRLSASMPMTTSVTTTATTKPTGNGACSWSAMNAVIRPMPAAGSTLDREKMGGRFSSSASGLFAMRRL
jgi:hypothetical protein